MGISINEIMTSLVQMTNGLIDTLMTDDSYPNHDVHDPFTKIMIAGEALQQYYTCSLVSGQFLQRHFQIMPF